MTGARLEISPPLHAPRPLPRLLGIAGAAGAGKDVIADFLALYGYCKFSFSDGLYQEVADAFDVLEEDLTDRALKEKPTAALSLECCDDDGFIEAMLASGEINGAPADYDAPRSPRWILQRWGTEYRREQNPDYWVDRAKDAYRLGEPLMVNTSVRFFNEAAWIQCAGGTILRVHRDAALDEAHCSDAGLPDVVVDHDIDNNGTIGDLHVAVQRLLHVLSE